MISLVNGCVIPTANNFENSRFFDNAIPLLFQLQINMYVVSFIKCLECGKILESKFTHDYVKCSCPNETFLDGGDEYCRYGGVDMNKIRIIDSTTVYSFIQYHYPTYDSELDERSIHEIFEEIQKRLKKSFE